MRKIKQMKRFYKTVSVQKAEEGFVVQLDGKTIKTPMKADMCVPSEGLAHCIMQEWANQGDEIVPDTMPLTQVLNSKIDRVHKNRAELEKTVLRYLDTDLICYRGGDEEGIEERQESAWNPWVEWFGQAFGFSLKTTPSLAAIRQEEGAHQSVQNYVTHLDDDAFTLLYLITTELGSLVVALAFMQEAIDTDTMLQIAFVEEDLKDELYKAEKYGPDPMIDKKRKALALSLQAYRVYRDNLSK